jgi:hypothetical protein
MFDNLRDEAASKSFYEEEAKFQPAAGTGPSPSPRRSRRILGMTGIQRFVIAFMIMLAVCIIGAMALLATGKIGF